MTTFVYVMAGWRPNRIAKVGVSENLAERLASLRHQSGRDDLKLWAAYPMPNFGVARSVERHAHRELNPHRTVGEWFAVNDYLAIFAVERAILLVLRGLSVATQRSLAADPSIRVLIPWSPEEVVGDTALEFAIVNGDPP